VSSIPFNLDGTDDVDMTPVANPERKQAMVMEPNPAYDKVTTIPEFNPSGSELVTHIKALTEEIIHFIEKEVPNNRRRSIALTNYEQAAMWAVKACFP